MEGNKDYIIEVVSKEGKITLSVDGREMPDLTVVEVVCVPTGYKVEFNSIEMPPEMRPEETRGYS